MRDSFKLAVVTANFSNLLKGIICALDTLLHLVV